MRRREENFETPTLLPNEDGDELWTAIGRNLHVYRGDNVWVVVHVAEVLYEFSADDVATKRMCMAQLSLQKLATEEEIAEAFACSRATVCRAKAAFLKQGARGVLPRRRGPKGPRLEPGLEDKIVRVRREGCGYRSISRQLMVPRQTVFTVCKRHGLTGHDRQRKLSFEEGAHTAAQGDEEQPGERVEDEGSRGESATAPRRGAEDAPSCAGESPRQLAQPLAEVPAGEPAPARALERALARGGQLGKPEVAPEFVSGSEVPAAGVLLAMALVAKDGCLGVARRVYGALSNGFYGLRSLVLTLLTSAWLGIKSVDSLQHGTPHLWGRLLGLDRLAETKTIHRKLNEVAARKLAREFMSQMAEHRIQANKGACAVLYVDGHVRQYHGRRRVSKRFVTRRGLAMPAIEDWWLHDSTCSPLLKIPGRPDRSLVAMVPEIVKEARQWIGDDRPLTVVFDRGGWSPKLFVELAAEGIRVVTYRKGKRRSYPLREFDLEVPVAGRTGAKPKVYRTRDRRTRIGGHTFRSATILAKNDHQTEIITTDLESETAVIVSEMFSRWGQENYFKYERTHRTLDVLGCHDFEPVPDDVDLPNPAHQQLDRQAKEAQSRLRKLEAQQKNAGSAKPKPTQIDWWRARVAKLKTQRRATPRRIRVADLPEDQRPEQPHPERKLFNDVLNMSAHRIETRLLGMLANHYKSTHKDGRELLRQIFKDTGDFTVQGDVLTVTLNPLASPHQTAALAGLCSEVNTANPTFPETNIRLRFDVQEHP
jgi:prepilin-type processing-associated H-X9-DG protein